GAPERHQLTPRLMGSMKQLRRARSSRHGHHLALPRPPPAGASSTISQSPRARGLARVRLLPRRRKVLARLVVLAFQLCR
ncbi:unnamed protein product, partial [Symbiodinium microadriaticum]